MTLLSNPTITYTAHDKFYELKMITIALITNRVREIAGKIKNKEVLTEEDQIFAKNALIEFADRLERKSKSATRTPNDLLQDKQSALRRTSILEARIENHYKRLLDIKIEKKRAGRKPLKK